MTGEFQHINLDYLTQMADGDRELQRDMLRMLIKALREEVPAMRGLGAAGDWHGLAEASHRFKTTIGFSGSEAMIAATAEIESIAAGGAGAEQIPGLLAALEAEQPHVLAELEAAMERLA